MHLVYSQKVVNHLIYTNTVSAIAVAKDLRKLRKKDFFGLLVSTHSRLIPLLLGLWQTEALWMKGCPPHSRQEAERR